MICSFSGKRGFRKPALWGYYANGFKGIAIEIEVRDAEVRKVKYVDDVTRVMDSDSRDDVVDRILTTKLSCWRHEGEYRYLTKDDRGYHAIGEITGLYFGNPYGNVGNSSDVQRHESIRKYVCRSRLLRKIARKKRIPCKDVHIEGGCVRVGVWPVGSTPHVSRRGCRNLAAAATAAFGVAAAVAVGAAVAVAVVGCVEEVVRGGGGLVFGDDDRRGVV